MHEAVLRQITIPNITCIEKDLFIYSPRDYRHLQIYDDLMAIWLLNIALHWCKYHKTYWDMSGYSYKIRHVPDSSLWFGKIHF